MTSPNSTQIDKAQSMPVGARVEKISTETATNPLGLSAFAPLAALSVVCDSLHLLSAFGWGKEGRLSRKNSAKLCDLMNSWN